MIQIAAGLPDAPLAARLIEAMTAELNARYGTTGAASRPAQEYVAPNGCFIVA